MNIEGYRLANNMTTEEVVGIIKPHFPKFSKSTFSMVKNNVYGVVLAPKAVKALAKAHPIKKENRTKSNRLTVRLDDRTYHRLQDYCKATHQTIQSGVEQIIINELNLLT